MMTITELPAHKVELQKLIDKLTADYLASGKTIIKLKPGVSRAPAITE